MSDQVHLMCDKLQYSWGGGGVVVVFLDIIHLHFLSFLSSVISRGLRMPPMQPLTLEPQTAVERPAGPLPLMLTMAPNPPPASQDGPRREVVVG